MTLPPSFHEELISQIPALRLLMGLGWTYLTPTEALALRRGKLGAALLEDVLAKWLAEHNAITSKGKTVPFSEANLAKALDMLADAPLVEGLVAANERIYELLTLGTSLKQTVDGDAKSFNLHYIDWQHPENNVYHVTDEFPVERTGSHETRRPDVVLFVNGIPLVVIECKRPDLTPSEGGRAVEEAITQMIRNQKRDEIPGFFVYSQLLLAVSVNEALYATTATPKKFWGLWREEVDKEQAAAFEAELARLVNRPLSDVEQARLYGWRVNPTAVRRYFDDQDAAGERLPTPQDRTLHALLRPERLLRLAYQYIVYDGGVKKIARYQQYFAVEETVRRVAHLNTQGERTGGVIWHTTGTGKSLTMVMLAKALALHPNIRTPRVVIVTDRIDLDAQIWGTFRACGKQVKQAKSGQDLARLLREGKADIITTVIGKFEAVAQLRKPIGDVDVFVLVDEGQRSQYGSAHAKMRQALPHACYIGFTGTPLLRAEKSTAAKFGGFIHSYSMRRAVEDQAVVSLLYEGRMAELDVDQGGIDKWFERVTQGLTDEQRADLKRKFSRAEAITAAEQRVKQIAYDLSDHFSRNFSGTGLKAQLATASKALALKYKRYLNEFGLVTSAVVISPPDTREGNEEVDEAQTPGVEAFWKRMMERYRTEEAYIREIKEDFGRPDGVELLIVVDKLLVGFDEPRNTVLYVDKPLKEHALLQAIARVNRLYEGKDFGYVIDYRGVLGELNAAMQTYNALEGYDSADIAGTITDVSAEIARLPGLHSALWAIFNPVPNKQDVEALQRFLAPEDRRQEFYDALTAYAKTLSVALGAVAFHNDTPPALVETYQRDLRFFHGLRLAVKQRYAETVDYRDYERKVGKLLDTHIRSNDVTVVTPQVNIFDVEAFDAAVAQLATPAAQADTIAHQAQRTIAERLERDPAFYKKFSRLIDEAIAAYRQGRIDEAEYLRRATEAVAALRAGRDDALPAELRRYRDAPAYYGVIREPLIQYIAATPGQAPNADALAAEMAIRCEGIIEANKVRDWTQNPDVQNRMRLAMEDYLDEIERSRRLALTDGDRDVILDSVIYVARQRDARR